MTSTVTLSSTTATLTEGGASGNFIISRGADTSGALTVNLTTAGSSASLSSTDYTLNIGGVPITVMNGNLSVIIPSGQSAVALSMTALQEAVGFAEGSETLQLNLATGMGYTIGSNNTASIAIAANGFVVTTTNATGEGSLSQAIANANAIAGNDIITFAGATFTDATPDTILLNGELNITSNITITGTGANLLTLSGGNTSRIFKINSGTIVTLDGLTIVNGFVNGSGGGILNTGNLTIRNSIIQNNTASGNSSDGGGVYNQSGGVLSVQNSTIRNNTAGDDGGGIRNDGDLTLLNSTINNNTAIGSSVVSGGGGLINVTGATATISNSTFSGNVAPNGGAIRNDGIVTVRNSTITNNRAISKVGGIGNSFNQNTLTPIGRTTLQNSIIAGNIDGDPSSPNFPDVGGGLGSFTDSGNNLIGVSIGLNSTIHSTTLSGTIANPLNPLLAPLGNYGGSTQTHALLPGSPAINAGSSAGAPTTDQRSMSRVGAVDIGAFEFHNLNVAPTVKNPIPDRTIAAEAPFQMGLDGVFEDADVGDRLSYSATLANGTVLPNWLQFDPVMSRFSGTPTNLNAGILSIRVTATDQEGASISDIFNLQVGFHATALPITTISLVGGAGNDINRVTGTTANDRISGMGGNDWVRGFDGDDVLFGGAGNDRLEGGNGDDFLMGGRGFDRLRGGEGKDVFVLRRDTDFDVVLDFQNGQDRIGLSGDLRFGNLWKRRGINNSTELGIRGNSNVLMRINNVLPWQIDATDFTLVPV